MEEFLKTWLKNFKLHESTISMLMGTFVVIVVGALLYGYFSGIKNEEGTISDDAVTVDYALKLEQEEGGKVVPAGLPVTHKVVRGETLWKISEKYYGNGYNWIDVATENKLVNPEIIEVGQSLSIPKTELRVPPKQTTMITSAKMNTIEGNNYKVVKGDTLWSIAVRAYQDGYQWTKIYNANKNQVTNPNLIEKEMVLTIPR